jgi:methionyl aminopeptidase
VSSEDRSQYERQLDDGWTIVTTDGSLSSQSGHTVLVTRSGCEILTLGPAS